uniref:Uncharacterized protein n=1 Tax=Tetranychus urticae TaxID=32264 RepID=T1KZF0_TETUR
MLFFSAILLSLVQFAFLAYNPNDPCFYGVTYCLSRDGSTECTGNNVAKVSLSAGQNDKSKHLSVSILAYHSKGSERVTLSIGFNVKGKPYTLYCLSDGAGTFKPGKGSWATQDFNCNMKLTLTENNNQVAPVTNSSISIDAATIDKNVPITLGFNNIKAVVAPNLKELASCWK